MMIRRSMNLSVAIILLGLLTSSALGQSMPHTFTANTPAKASEVNANFTYLLERFGGIRETTVKCGTSGTGSGINSAIQNGYNSIVINGICKENIIYDARDTFTPRVLRLRGANNDSTMDKIVDNSSYEKTVLTAWYTGMILIVDNLTISGGDRGIASWSNNTLVLRNIKVEGYKNFGLTIGGSSVLDGKNLIVDGSYSSASSSEKGFALGRDGVAYLENLTITNNQDKGLELYNAQIELLGTNVFTGNGTGINVGSGSFLVTSGSTSISNSLDYGIRVDQGMMKSWTGSITINTTASGEALRAYQSNINIKGLTATGDGTSVNNLITLDDCVSDLRNLNLSNSGESGLKLNNSESYIDNLTSKNNTENGINAWRSKIKLKNSKVSGNKDDGINISSGSLFTVESSTISSNGDTGLSAFMNSNLRLKKSSVTANTNKAIRFGEGSYLEVSESTVTGASGKVAINGNDDAVLKIGEDSGSTVISTTNNSAVSLNYLSSGQIRSGVEVSSTGGTSSTGVCISRGSLINIESGASISGDSFASSIFSDMDSKVDIEYGAVVASVKCGNDNQSMVILNDSDGNYPSTETASNCISYKN